MKAPSAQSAATELSNKNENRLNLACTFLVWREQRDRSYALVAAVRNSLSTRDDAFNELQLLNIALEELGDAGEFNKFAKLLGVSK